MGNDTFGFGQLVVKLKVLWYIAVFRPLAMEVEAGSLACSVVQGNIEFLALTTDARVHFGMWQVVANCPVQPDLPLPAFRRHVVDASGLGWFIVDYRQSHEMGHQGIRVSAEEAAPLPNEWSVSPMSLEYALKALHGLEVWREADNKLRPSEHTTRRYFGSN
jgi:hypothetical protein